MSDKTKVWYAVDEDGTEFKYMSPPYRQAGAWYCEEYMHPLFGGSIKKETGVNLTWEDEPLECTICDDEVTPVKQEIQELNREKLLIEIKSLAVWIQTIDAGFYTTKDVELKVEMLKLRETLLDKSNEIQKAQEA